MAPNLEELYLKFPSILRKKLQNKELLFPEDTEFDYESKKAYRVVRRDKDDFSEIRREDFDSHFDIYVKTAKKPKGTDENWLNQSEYYAASLFEKKEILEQRMMLPKPTKKIIEGEVRKEGGPRERNSTTCHVNWWLFEKADVSNFRFIEKD